MQSYYLTVVEGQSPRAKWVSLVENQGISKAGFPSGGFRQESVSVPFLASVDCLHSLAHNCFCF